MTHKRHNIRKVNLDFQGSGESVGHASPLWICLLRGSGGHSWSLCAFVLGVEENRALWTCACSETGQVWKVRGEKSSTGYIGAQTRLHKIYTLTCDFCVPRVICLSLSFCERMFEVGPLSAFAYEHPKAKCRPRPWSGPTQILHPAREDQEHSDNVMELCPSSVPLKEQVGGCFFPTTFHIGQRACRILSFTSHEKAKTVSQRSNRNSQQEPLHHKRRILDFHKLNVLKLKSAPKTRQPTTRILALAILSTSPYKRKQRDPPPLCHLFDQRPCFATRLSTFNTIRKHFFCQSHHLPKTDGDQINQITPHKQNLRQLHAWQSLQTHTKISRQLGLQSFELAKAHEKYLSQRQSTLLPDTYTALKSGSMCDEKSCK